MIRGAVLDPLVVKELRGLSRGWTTHAGRLVYVGLVGVILYAFHLTYGSSSHLSPSEYADLGRRLFSHFFWPNLLLVTVASVLAASDLVTREVRGRMLGLLLLSPCTPFRIALGKWKASMVQVLTLVCCGAPVLAICLYLGGIGFREMAWGLSLTVSMAVLGTSFAVRYSAKHSTTARALLASLLMLAVYSIPGAPFFFIIGLVSATWDLREGRRLLAVILLAMGGLASCIFPYFIHPIYAGLDIFSDFAGWEHSWIPATLFSFGVAWLVLRSAARHINGRGAALADLETPPIDAILQDPFPRLSLPGVHARRIKDQVWENRPLLWKELATRAATRVNPSLKLILFVVLLLLILPMFLITGGRVVGMVFFFWAILLVLGLLLGASLFTHEKEGRKFEMLLAAPLSSWEIVRAKLLGGVLSPESRRVLILWAITVLGWSWWAGPLGVLMFALTSGLFLAFAYVLAALASLRARTLPGAFVSSAALAGLLLILPLFFLPQYYPPGSVPLNAAWFIASLNPFWVLDPFLPFGEDARFAAAEAFPRFLTYCVYYGILIPLVILITVRSFGRAAAGSRS